jgi:hypothetical protein
MLRSTRGDIYPDTGGYRGCANGDFRGAGKLVDAIEHYVSVDNKHPKPFVWAAKANDILHKVTRANSR